MNINAKHVLARYWSRLLILTGAGIPAAIGFAIGTPYPCDFWFLGIIVVPLLVVIVVFPIAIVTAFPATFLPKNSWTTTLIVCLSIGLAFAAYHVGVTTAPPLGRCDL